jgi:5'-nucleotidase
MKNEKKPIKDFPPGWHTGIDDKRRVVDIDPDARWEWEEQLRELRKNDPPKTLFIDMDGVLVDFQTGIDRLDERTRTEYEGHLDDVAGIFSLMDPMPGALEAYATLCQHFDTYILSTAAWNNPSAWSDKLLWVKHHLNDHAYKRLILSHHKHLNRGHFLVDDRPNNGAEHFKGTWLQFGSERFPHWEAVTGYLLERK